MVGNVTQLVPARVHPPRPRLVLVRIRMLVLGGSTTTTGFLVTQTSPLKGVSAAAPVALVAICATANRFTPSASCAAVRTHWFDETLNTSIAPASVRRVTTKSEPVRRLAAASHESNAWAGACVTTAPVIRATKTANRGRMRLNFCFLKFINGCSVTLLTECCLLYTSDA